MNSTSGLRIPPEGTVRSLLLFTKFFCYQFFHIVLSSRVSRSASSSKITSLNNLGYDLSSEPSETSFMGLFSMFQSPVNNWRWLHSKLECSLSKLVGCFTLFLIIDLISSLDTWVRMAWTRSCKNIYYFLLLWILYLHYLYIYILYIYYVNNNWMLTICL